ncbi:hypothetical protein H4Q32_027962 [Labeo rohita]|uniref:Uncharacterized protein n=1 Tax=Labeo rohita TaxID=84645 RepID=A0ABQ8L8D7_LABRO|nr:hypothetical protein H4Q32_027962 [Labeo rohita]
MCNAKPAEGALSHVLTVAAPSAASLVTSCLVAIKGGLHQTGGVKYCFEPSQATVDLHEPSQVAADLHEPSQVAAVIPEPSQATADLHEPSQATVDLHEPSQATADLHEPSQATADLPEPIQVTAVLHESSQVTAGLPESSQVKSRQASLSRPLHVSADHQEPHHVSAELPEPTLPSHAEPTFPNHKSTASTPSRPTDIPLSTVLPVMAIAIFSVWAAHCAPEASSAHEYAPEASSVHESAPEASSVHEFTPILQRRASIYELTATSAQESAPIPPEVSVYAVEPPKEVAPIYELTATSAQESAPMPPEVSAPAVDPPMGAASSHELPVRHATVKRTNHELSAHHATAQKAYHELSTCHATAQEIVHEHTALLWMSLVPLWISLLLSVLPALQWLPVMSALPTSPWLPVLPLCLPRHGSLPYLLCHCSTAQPSAASLVTSCLVAIKGGLHQTGGAKHLSSQTSLIDEVDKDARTAARHLLERKKTTFGTKPGKDRTSLVKMQFVPFTHLETDS